MISGGGISLGGAADSGNSTTTPLGIGGVFTGTAFDVLNYSTVIFTVTSDVASAAGGLVLEWGPNGVNWDTLTTMALTAAQTRGFDITHRGRFFRIRYTNGAVAQTTFRIGALHRPANVGIISRTISETVFDDNLAHTTRSVLVGKRTDGLYGNVRTNNNDRLLVSTDAGWAEDSPHVSGDAGNFILAVRNDTPIALTSADGDYSPIAVDSFGRLLVSITPAELVITATAAANTALTLTIPAAGAGLFHYISYIRISRTATAALAGSATLVVTTTNFPGALAWSFGNAMVAGGTQSDVSESFTHAIKSAVANTATTIVAPAAGAAVLWRMQAFYNTRV